MSFLDYLFHPKLSREEKRKLKDMEKEKYLKLREKQIKEKYGE